MKLYRLTYLESGSRDTTLRLSLENVKKSIAFWSKVHRRHVRYVERMREKGISVSEAKDFKYLVEEADVEWTKISV